MTETEAQLTTLTTRMVQADDDLNQRLLAHTHDEFDITAKALAACTDRLTVMGEEMSEAQAELVRDSGSGVTCQGWHITDRHTPRLTTTQRRDLTSQLDGCHDALSALDGRVSGVSSQLEATQSELKHTKQSLTELSEGVTALSDTVSAVQDEVADNDPDKIIGRVKQTLTDPLRRDLTELLVYRDELEELGVNQTPQQCR